MAVTNCPKCNPPQFEVCDGENLVEIILSYISTFLGYGNLDCPFRFFGMEEGGGSDPDEVKRRFNLWNENKNPTEDLVEFQTAIGITQWFTPQPRFQSTWKRLIRIYLEAHGCEVTRELSLDFQMRKLGRRQIEPSNPSPCLFELMPLPSPGLDDCPCYWLAQSPHLNFLSERDDYLDHVLPARIKLAREHIQKFKPEIVCFYGMDYLKRWEEIAGAELQRMDDGDKYFYHSHQNDTLFIVSLHPAAFGLRNTYFDSIGKFIAANRRRSR